MGPFNTRKASWLGSLLAGATAVAALALGAAQLRAADAPAAQVDPSAYLYGLGFKFQPASTCSNVKCHGADTRDLTGADYKDNSYTLWNKEDTADAPADPHRTSFKKLRGPRATAIVTAMHLKPATTETKCLACHTINPPPALLAGEPLLGDGVTCNGCHGPSGAGPSGDKGWVDLHTVKGWHAEQRKAFAHNHEGLLKKFGFFDTKPLIPRAERCISCHLAIDPAMVAAGHPQPTFELNWFSVTYSNRHWDDPTDKFFGVQLWAAGQSVALHAALQQLADRSAAGASPADVISAYNQVYAHYSCVSALTSSGAIKGSLSEVTTQLIAANKALPGTAGANPAALSAAAKAGAEAATKLYPTVEQDAFTPDKAASMKVLDALFANPTLPALAGGFGIEQQRDGIFAIYNAYAGTVPTDKAVSDNRDFIGAKLFPTDAKGNLTPADKIPVADYKKALAEVKTKLGA